MLDFKHERQVHTNGSTPLLLQEGRMKLASIVGQSVKRMALLTPTELSFVSSAQS